MKGAALVLVFMRLVALLVVLSAWTAGGVLVDRAFGPLALVVYTMVELAVIVYANHRWEWRARRAKAH